MSLFQGHGRRAAKTLCARFPKPGYDQSTRDGYAIRGPGHLFQVIGEVAAGDRADREPRPGQALRIMTGAPVPAGCERVVPFEQCRERDGAVEVQEDEAPDFIRRRGSDLEPGTVIVDSGQRLAVEHLLLLAEDGRGEIPVFARPRVMVLCTGSELVPPGQRPGPGQKVSGNGVLLRVLVEQYGGQCVRVETVADEPGLITAGLERLLADRPDLILTTGGMGPGRFDLLEEIFTRLRGELLYNSLKVRPGKSTLFGILAGVPLFGLPGPPPAVHLLFHELVAPALSRLQGDVGSASALVPARLVTGLAGGRSHHLNLKGGQVRFEAGVLTICPLRPREPMTAIMHLDGSVRYYPAGSRVRVRLLPDFSSP